MLVSKCNDSTQQFNSFLAGLLSLENMRGQEEVWVRAFLHFVSEMNICYHVHGLAKQKRDSLDGGLSHVIPSVGNTSQFVVCGSLSGNGDVSRLECLTG